MTFVFSCSKFLRHVSAVNVSLKVVLTRQHLFMCLLAVNCSAIYFLSNVLINHHVIEEKGLGIRKSEVYICQQHICWHRRIGLEHLEHVE